MSRYLHPSVQIRDSEGGMGKGLFAAQDIPKDTIIVKIYQDQFIIYNLMCYHEFKQISSELQIHDEKVLFAVYLSFIYLQPEAIKHKLIKQKRYLRELPQKFDNLICWSKDQLELLQNQQLKIKIEGRINRIKNQFLVIKKCLVSIIKTKHEVHQYRLFEHQQDILNISFNLVLRMYSAIESRNLFYISQEDPDSKVGALLPILQIFNHSRYHQVSVQYIQSRYLAKTLRKVEAGQQLFVKYGDHQYERYLEWYGFLPDIPQEIKFMCRDQNYRKYLAKVYCMLKANS